MVQLNGEPRLSQDRSRLRVALLLGGVAGPILFTLLYLVLGATQAGYDAWRRPVSDLSAGDAGGVQIAGFVLFGLLVAGLAIPFSGSPAPAGGRWTPVLLILVGCALILAGVFVTDPAPGYPPGNQSQVTTLHGALHLFASILVFTSLPVACFVMAQRFRRSELKLWSAYSLVSGLLMWAFLFAFGVTNSKGGPAGLFERAAITTGWVWISLQAVRLLARRGSLRSAG